MGLFIANKIAQAHGGSIDVQSKEGEGSHFVVELLRKRPDIEEDEKNEDESEPTLGGE